MTNTLARTGVALCLLLGAAGALAADRLNHTIAVLEDGGAAFGIFSGDRSASNARRLARSDLDYVFIDMEHGPYSAESLQQFLFAMTDKAAIAKSGKLTMNTTPIVRLPINGREGNQFLAKQVLDLGVFGVMFPMINNREEAEFAIASTRFPQARGAKDFEPAGLRGRAPGNAVWYWGTSYSDYLAKADVWPLDPQGEILAVIQIESPEAVKNIEEIITTPGVGAIFIGPSDLSANYGLPQSDPEVEGAIQTVLKACLKHNIACGLTTNARNVEERTRQGFRFVTVGGDGGITPGTAEALALGRKAAGR